MVYLFKICWTNHLLASSKVSPYASKFDVLFFVYENPVKVLYLADRSKTPSSSNSSCFPAFTFSGLFQEKSKI